MHNPNPIAHLLEEVIQAAKVGDLHNLSTLTNRLDQEVSQLTLSEEAQLLEVRRLATEASTLLESALRGVTAARQRLAEIRSVRKGAGTYGGNGQRVTLSIPHHETRRV